MLAVFLHIHSFPRSQFQVGHEAGDGAVVGIVREEQHVSVDLLRPMDIHTLLHLHAAAVLRGWRGDQ